MPDYILDHPSKNTVTCETIFSNSIITGLPVAVWRLPDAQAIHLSVDLSHAAVNDVSILNSLPSGFLIHPFDRKTSSIHYIKSDLSFHSKNGIRLGNDLSREQLHLADKLLNSPPAISTLKNLLLAPIELKKFQISSQEYQNLVTRGIEYIEQGRLKKVVAARFKALEVSESVNIMKVFERVCQQYPSAFVSIIFHPETGCWMGATPELLISKSESDLFRTTALAGTQKVLKGIDPSTISWSHKEIEEQALVSRYIINCFKTIRLREYEEDGPKTILTGDLAHLKTDFSVDMREVHFENLDSTMLQLLHPTSAVGGMPREESLQFIKEHEGFNRELYSGFLGPVNQKNETNLFVNIRCVRIFKSHIQLFAGAGITRNSIPEKEWLETSAKMMAMESLFY